MQTGTTPTRTSPRRTPRSRTEARGDGVGGAPTCGRAAPRTAGAWWDRHGRDDGDGDAWARWNHGGQGTRPGGHSGYGGNERLRPKPAQTAAALGRNLTREEWIEELIADAPNPAHPEFRAPGAWERWVRGAFRTYKKIGDAKYRVKTKRANADMEVRGADPDFNNRGGRSAAMDPSTATDPRVVRGGGQKRQGRSRDDEGGRGPPMAREGAAASSSNWWSARGYEWETHQGNEHRDEVPSPAADGEATPHVTLVMLLQLAPARPPRPQRRR